MVTGLEFALMAVRVTAVLAVTCADP